MNNVNEIFLAYHDNVILFNDDSLFMTDLLLNGRISVDNYLFYRNNSFGHSLYPFDFYLCMLCAGISEDMLFSASPECESVYGNIESMAYIVPDKCDQLQSCEAWFDPAIAVYGGRNDFAERLTDITGYYIYDRLIEAGCWDYIDRITDLGKNEKHIEIMTDMIVKDHIRGKNGFWEYTARYNCDKLTVCGEAIDNALLEINNADRLFALISKEAGMILNKSAPDVDRRKFNERAADIMCRCARLGMTLKEYRGFDNILLPVYRKHGPVIFCEEADCPCDMARLIDENTMVYIEIGMRKDNTMLVPNVFEENTYSGYCVPDICRFVIESKKNYSETDTEFFYICKDFNKRFGHRITVRIESADALFGLRYMPRELFDIYLCDSVLEEIHSEIRSLKNILNYGILSQENIDEITAYFASRVNASSGKKHSFALKRLKQLNDHLIKIGGKAE